MGLLRLVLLLEVTGWVGLVSGLDILIRAIVLSIAEYIVNVNRGSPKRDPMNRWSGIGHRRCNVRMLETKNGFEQSFEQIKAL
jgi:hypothetical protein